MRKQQLDAANRLLNERFIDRQQMIDIQEYRARNVFSLHNELQALLYVSVLLFSSGAGIIIYKNIDSIGHIAILAVLFAICVGCYLICFKKSDGFSKHETDFDHPAYNYLVLVATLLSCTFVGYLQYQYEPFGNHFGIAAFVSALIALGSAYYFDNRNALAVGLTALTTAIGITATPQALFKNSIFDNPALFYYGIALGFLLVFWAEYSQRSDLKKHFAPVILIFAQQLTAICAITGMFDDFWPVYSLFLILILMYCWRKSYALRSTTLFVFALVYGFIGFNILLFKLIDWFGPFFEILTILSPVYFIGSIFLFIRAIKHFNRKTDEGTF